MLKAYRSMIAVLLLALLVAACTPAAPEAVENDIPAVPVTGGDEITPAVPATGAESEDVQAAVNDLFEQATAAVEQFANVEDYEAYFGLPVYDQDGNYLGILEHVVPGPQGLSDFALVSTWENLYRTLPVSALNLPEAMGRIDFEGEMHQFMGSPTYQTIQGLDFDLEAVRNAVIGYWQHQVDITAPQR